MKTCRILAFFGALAGPLVLGARLIAQDVQLFAVLNGGNEVGATGLAAAGDADGTGAA